jgi:hypothetical protein
MNRPSADHASMTRGARVPPPAPAAARWMSIALIWLGDVTITGAQVWQSASDRGLQSELRRSPSLRRTPMWATPHTGVVTEQARCHGDFRFLVGKEPDSSDSS